jgi:hypothetical protein
MFSFSVLLLTLAILFWFHPSVLVYPLIAVFVWSAVAFFSRGYKLYRRKGGRETGTRMGG